MINQLPSPAPGVTRCNSLGLSGHVLGRGQPGAKAAARRPACGCSTSRASTGRAAKSLDDLKLSFFDTSGPQSRGVHNLWFVDGEFAHLTTGMRDFAPPTIRTIRSG
jgi:hypothetical protein